VSKFLVILLGHLIADYPLQGDFLANFKSKNMLILLTHCFIYGLTMGLFLQYLDCYDFYKVSLILVVHIIVDIWKCEAGKKYPDKALKKYLYIDQAIHIGTAFLVILK